MRVGVESGRAAVIAILLLAGSIYVDYKYGLFFFLGALCLTVCGGFVLFYVFRKKQEWADQQWAVLLLLEGLAVFFALFGSGWLAAQSQANAYECKSNLDEFIEAIEQYEKTEGQLPPTLAHLAPTYLSTFPACPRGGATVYIDGYAVHDGRYDLCCKGNYHRGLSSQDYPRVVSSKDGYESTLFPLR